MTEEKKPTTLPLFGETFGSVPLAPLPEAAADGPASNLPAIPPHPLKSRREEVRRLKLEGASRTDIARAVEESVDTVKKDLIWLRKGGYLPKE
jgi:DNA invertase Pin-like site-specific DNA recombinase